MNKRQETISALYEILGKRILSSELPVWLEEGICQYLSLSAEEKDIQALSTKASFAVQKRNRTCLHLNAAIHEETSVECGAWQFVMGAVDFLEEHIDEKNLYVTLRQKWKKFSSSEKIATAHTWPVDYLLKTAFF